MTAFGQVVTQNPAPKVETPGANDSRVRDAVRKALGTDAPAPTTPVPIPVAPVTPVTPNKSDSPLRAETVSYPAAGTNSGMTNVTFVSLSLDEAIRLALEHNLDLQVERYNPVIAEYDRRALYGYYDPVFNSGLSRANNNREAGGLNVNTGIPFPSTRSETDTASLGLGGILPTGMRYDVTQNLHENTVVRPFLVGSNAFGPVFGKATTDTWDSQGLISVSQPLLRDFWIDATRLRINLARRNLRISELTLERDIMVVVTKVEEAYYDLIGARETVTVREMDVAVKQQFFNENHRKVEVGALAPLEEKLAQSELALANTTLLLARSSEVDAETFLKNLIYDDFIRQFNVRLKLTDKLIAVPTRIDFQEAAREASLKRPDLQARRLNLEKQQLQLKYDFNQLFPRLDVFATWGVNGLDRHASGALDDEANKRFQQDSYGLSLSFPLSLWAERNNYKSSKAAKAQAILDLKRLEETIFGEVDVIVRLLRTQWETIPLTRERTAYQQAALEAEQKKLVFGKSTSFEVLKIASDLTSARLNEIIAVKEYNKSLAELSLRNGSTFERWRIDPPVRSNR